MDSTTMPGGREVSPETFAKLTDTPLETVWSWIHGRSTRRFDERDLVRRTKRTVRIIYQIPNAAGKGGRPRMADSVHKAGGRLPVDVDPVQDAGIESMAHPRPQDIQGDSSLRMVSGEGMPQGFKVFRRARRTAHTAQE